MTSRAGNGVEHAAGRGSETAGAVGLALLLAAMAGAGWVAAGAIPGRSNGGLYVEYAAGLAAVPCAIAAYEAIRLIRGKQARAGAVAWFAVACAMLLLLLLVAAVSNSDLG